MATSIADLAYELKDQTRWQKTPMVLCDEDYVSMVKLAIRKLYVDTGRSSVYHSGMFHKDAAGNITFEVDLPADEVEYVMICAQLRFFQRVASDVNNIVGYVTDALTVTNADKPYLNLKDTMDRLENERRILYYKMVRYTMTSA